ncbi:MAG: (2Fe-2S)-binding protein [Chloroflexi bacterium]|jgi:predicted molibdopterin-dependent oxidoreductase YjgC|nr:(2Fe-2S)-binding protein [Chloroflexota bacterium]
MTQQMILESIEINDQSVQASAGQSVAAALLAAGVRIFRHTPEERAPRSIFCGMGTCFDCLVTIDGIPNQRACMTRIQPGMRIRTIPNEND